MRTITKLRRAYRAISPIFAVLLLIAIAVVGGIVVYLFTSGYLAGMIGGSGVGQEKVAIEAVVANATSGVITLHCKNLAGGDTVITDAILKDSSGNTMEVRDIADVTLVATGTLIPVPCDFTPANVQVGYSYTVTLVSQAGNQFVSSSVKASA